MSVGAHTRTARSAEPAGFGSIGRACTVVSRLGGRYSLELGIDVDAGVDEVERWALAATLLGSSSSTAVALRTYRVLRAAGVDTIGAAGERSREELVALLGIGGHDGESEATQLQALAGVLANRASGRLSTFCDGLTAQDQLERNLESLPGWGPATAHAFLRELRGVWRAAEPALDERAAAAAAHTHLPTTLDALASLSTVAELDLRDMEAGLVRLALCHDFAVCPGGEECPFASLDPAQCVHF